MSAYTPPDFDCNSTAPEDVKKWQGWFWANHRIMVQPFPVQIGQDTEAVSTNYMVYVERLDGVILNWTGGIYIATDEEDVGTKITYIYAEFSLHDLPIVGWSW